jgi:hypothetical protein
MNVLFQSVLTAGFWAAGISAVMSPDNDLAVDSYAGGLSNPNLYFFSWGAFALSFMVLFACVSNSLRNSGISPLATITDDTDEHRCSRSSWAGLLVTSFVVMVAASRLYQDLNCDTDDSGVILEFDANCNRTKFAVSLGVISFISSFVWMLTTKFLLKEPLGSRVEFGLVGLLLIFWTFGVTLLTFDQHKAPARDLGNLYFFTWGSWLLTVFMAVKSLRYIISSTKEATDGDAEEEGKKEPVVDEETEAATGTVEGKKKPVVAQGDEETEAPTGKVQTPTPVADNSV